MSDKLWVLRFVKVESVNYNRDKNQKRDSTGLKYFSVLKMAVSEEKN